MLYYQIGGDGRRDSLLVFLFSQGNIMGQADTTLEGADKKGGSNANKVIHFRDCLLTSVVL
jgi:hypothetical protein